ncbi:hypothetical protein MKW92_043765, partial [Papaver armeniacum]
MLFHPIMLPLATLFISYVIFCILRKLGSNRKLNLPPSPSSDSHHREFSSNNSFYGPILLFKFGSKPTLVVSSAEATSDILKPMTLFSQIGFPAKAFKILFFGGNDIIFSPYNEQWKELRKVNSFKYIREEEVDRMIENIAPEQGNKFNKEYTDRFIGLIEKANSLADTFSLGDFFPWLQWLDIVSGYDGKLRKAAQELNIFFDQIIDDSIRMNSQADDCDHDKDERRSFIDILISHAGKNKLSFSRDCMKGLIM